jgi:hypothetical protein
MRRRRAFRPQRAPIFVGCEGESERGYVALLGRLAEEAALPVHLDPVLLQPGGGDPLAIVERAVQQLGERRRKRQTVYQAQFVLLDRDKWGQAPARDSRIAGVAARAGLGLVWQAPCHEAMLLRHLEHCATLRPPTTTVAAAQIAQRWPTYDKPMDAADLAARLDRAAVLRAAAVEPDLAPLIAAVGLIEEDG